MVGGEGGGRNWNESYRNGIQAEQLNSKEARVPTQLLDERDGAACHPKWCSDQLSIKALIEIETRKR